MKKRTAITLSLILIIAAAAAAAFIGAQVKQDRSVAYDYMADVESVSSYDKVLRFAGGSDFSPFSYLDENGLPCGHDVELAFAIGRELGCRVEVTLGDWTQMQNGIMDGTYDVLMTVDYSDERSQIMGYTSPVCIDSYVFFGKNSSIDTNELKNLKQMKIAALEGGGATDNYLAPLGLTENTTFYSSQIEAFKSVENGENDIAIAGYIYGSNIIAKLDMDLEQVGSPLYGSAYYFTYNINNTGLGPELNSALASLDASGEASAIEEKWTTHYQPNLTFSEYISRNRQSVLVISMAVLIAVIVLVEILYGRVRKREKILLETDQTTSLYNMRAFLERMSAILQKNSDNEYVLIRFDIDNFKGFNSTQGTKMGDRLLQSIGKGLQMQESMPDAVQLTGYLGADHFAVLFEKGRFTDDPAQLYSYIMGIIEKTCPGYNLSIRMGLSTVDDMDENPARYCDRSYTALRSIKNDYYRRWAWFDENLQEHIDEEKEISDKMFRALDEGRFVPYFQPQYDYSSNRICGAEVLARWRNEDGSILPPSKFIPVFEKNGFIYEMDKAIWQQSCECIKKWKNEGIMPPHLSTNISRADIYHSDLVDTLKRITSENDVSMDELHFEITESAYLQNSSLLIGKIKELKQIGSCVEMDDFGSGYSSLASLRDMDVDVIKLDMSLLQNNTLSGKDASILSGIVQLGKSMGLEIIAEGVEEKSQADYLISIGCSKMQGYFFSKPVSQSEFEELLREKR